MTIVRTTRTRFDEAIDDDLNVVLILAGASGTPAQAVHDAANTLVHTYRRVFILRSVTVLTHEEQELWVSAPQTFAYYNCLTDETRDWGSVEDLLDPQGLPDLLEIRDRFAMTEIQ
tara:strand:+ start:1042 stop:1389 length:348 start_codon:yes stop_codon:yes gene_type:complete